MNKPLFVAVENFLSVLDKLNLTTESTLPTDMLVKTLKDLGFKFPEDDE